MKFRRRVEEVDEEEEEEGEAALFLIGGSEKSERLFLGYASRLPSFFIKAKKKKKNTQIAIVGALPLSFIKRGNACIMPFHFKCLRLQEDRVGDHGE